MNVVYERCCGMDIHKNPVVACLIVPRPGSKPAKDVRSFGRMTANLRPWEEPGCTITLGVKFLPDKKRLQVTGTHARKLALERPHPGGLSH
jgi:hypothetical protein